MGVTSTEDNNVDNNNNNNDNNNETKARTKPDELKTGSDVNR